MFRGLLGSCSDIEVVKYISRMFVEILAQFSRKYLINVKSLA